MADRSIFDGRNDIALESLRVKKQQCWRDQEEAIRREDAARASIALRGIFAEQRGPTGRWITGIYYGAEATSPPFIEPSAPIRPLWLAPL
jgi:hypothetical protein